VSSLLSEAYDKAAASVTNAANRFRANGLLPVDQIVFSENDFIPSENLNTVNDILNGDACCSGTPQAREDLQEEVQSSEPSLENLHHTTNITTDGFPSEKKRVPIDKIPPFPKPTAHYEKRVKKGAQKLFFSLVAHPRTTSSLQQETKYQRIKATGKADEERKVEEQRHQLQWSLEVKMQLK
jgi:hypothetical protein